MTGVVKRAAKTAALAAGRRMADADVTRRRVVFCYHSVHPDRPYPSTTPALFEAHVAWLNAHARIVSLDELIRLPDGGPAVALTFDDGYEDNHAHVLPILSRHGVTATFFVTTGLVGRDPMVLARFSELWRCGPDDVVPMSWTQVRELRSSGMSIGTHTLTHPNLARLSDREAADELRIAREIVSERLSENIDLVAYPFGKPRVHVTRATMALARASGHRLAASITFRAVPYPARRYAIPRFFADGDSLAKIHAKLRGDYDPIGWWQERVPMPLMRFVSPRDFDR